MAIFPGLPWWAGTRKVKPIWILLKQESDWQWRQLGNVQVCTSLQTDNHAITPPLIKFFLHSDALPAAQPTASKHWRHLKAINYLQNIKLSRTEHKQFVIHPQTYTFIHT